MTSVRAHEVRRDHRRRRPQRTGHRRLPSRAPDARCWCWSAASWWAAAQSRKSLAGLPRLHRRVPHQPAAGAHHPRTGACPSSATRSTPRIRRSSPPFPTAAISSCGRTARRRWRRSPNSPSTTPKSTPHTRSSWSASRVVVEDLLLTTPPHFPPSGDGPGGLPEAGRASCADSARKTSSRWSRCSRRAPRIFSTSGSRSRAGEGHARHRRRDRRQRRPAIAGHRVHPAAPLHGRRGRASRTVGLRARRHGRGVGSHRRQRARQGRRDPHQRAGVESPGARRAGAAAWCWKTARRSRRKLVASNLDPKVTFLRAARTRATCRPTSSRRSASSGSKARAARSTWR